MANQYQGDNVCRIGLSDLGILIRYVSRKRDQLHFELNDSGHVAQGVLPPAPQNSLIKMDQVATGFLEGVMNLPVDGQWQVFASNQLR